MIVLDINILVGAHHIESRDHAALRHWMEHVMISTPFSFPDFVFFNFMRVVTLPRPWDRPSSTEEALAFCNTMMASSHFVLLQPCPEQWATFTALCEQTGAKGNLINDAYLAAYAIQSNIELITLDQDFSKFSGLRWRSPFDRHARTNPR